VRYAAKNPFSYVHANIGGQVALFETIKVRQESSMEANSRLRFRAGPIIVYVHQLQITFAPCNMHDC
jgi:hypothetical protein